MANPDVARLESIAREGRVQILRMLAHAGSGHPGGSLSVIDLLTALYFNRLRCDPRRPEWEDRDRIVLSKGHCVPAQYFCLAKAGFFPMERLATLRKLGSPLQGHPDRVALPGIETATGSLGQGLSVAMGFAVDHPGPLYLRLTRQNLEPVHGDTHRFHFGKIDVLRAGTDVSILATGGPLANALAAAKTLAAEGVSAEIINVATVKPLDEEGILACAGRTGRVVTVEDHSVHGGLGSAVAELLGEHLPTPFKRIGVTTFGESGDPKGLYAKHGLDVDGIARTTLKLLNR